MMDHINYFMWGVVLTIGPLGLLAVGFIAGVTATLAARTYKNRLGNSQSPTPNPG